MKNSFIVMSGMPLSGKSTFVRDYLPNHTVYSLNAEVASLAVVRGMPYPKVYDTLRSLAASNLKKQIELSAEENIVVDSCNITSRNRVDLLALAKNRLKIAIWLDPAPLEDIAERLCSNGLGLSFGDLKHYAGCFKKPTLQEGFDMAFNVSRPAELEQFIKVCLSDNLSS